MPTSYRFEISPNNRAGCQNKACKDAGLKITKGELRFGTWVEFSLGEREIQGWKWRHWGCITPTVIQNLLKALGGLEGIEGDLNVIDGYDELPQEWQEKVLTMLREGHVPDEDWKGDVEQNRPGKRGSHKKATSSKKKAEKDGDDDDAEETPTKAKSSKRRGKKVKAEASGDDEDKNPEGTPVKAKATKGRAKKVKSEASGNIESDDVLLRGGGSQLPFVEKLKTVSKKRKPGHQDLVDDGNDDEELPEKPAKKSAKKIKAGNAPEGIEADNNRVDGRRRRIAKNAKGKKTNDLKEEDSVSLAEPEPSAEDSKGPVGVEHLDGAADMKAEAGVKTEPGTVTKPPAKRGRSRKPVKVEDAEEDAGTMAGASAGPESKTGKAPEVEEERKPVARRRRPKNEVKVENAGQEAEETADDPAEVEQETAVAPDPENEIKPKAKAARKKGVAKAIAKPRINMGNMLTWANAK